MDASRLAAPVERLLLAGGFVVLFLFVRHALAGDDFTRFADIQQLLDDGQLSASKYSLVMPLFSAPVILLGHLVESPEWWAARFNVIVAAAGSLGAAAILRGRVDAALLRRTLLVLLFASLFANRLRDYNAEVLTTVLVALGLLCLATGRRVALGWAAIVIGAVNTPAAIVALVPVAAWQALRTRRLRHVAPLGTAALLVCAEAWLRRGGPFDFGYGDDHGLPTMLPYSGRSGFSYPFVLGVVSILFSFGRGLLFFTPGLVLWLSARTRRLAAGHRQTIVPMLLFVAGLVLVYAKWWAWYGGVSWGPRFFAFAAIPASLLIAFRTLRPADTALANAFTLVVLGLSAWVGVVGLLADPAVPAICTENGYALESFCWYVPEFSSLWQPLLHRPPIEPVALVWCVAVFAYLAVPIAAALVRTLRPTASQTVRGWRL